MTDPALPPRRRLRPALRRAAPFILLGASLLVAGVGAAAAHRAQASHRSTAEALLRDYGSFAAWSFADRSGEAVDRALRATLYPLRPAFFDAARPEPCLLELLAKTSGESCSCGHSIPGSYAFVVRLSPEGAPFFAGDSLPSAARQDELAALLRQHARGAYRRGWSYAMVEGGRPDELLAYVRMERQGGDTLVYGVQVDRDRLVDTFREALLAPDLLPPSLTHGLPPDSLLAVWVDAPGGASLFASAPDADATLAGTQAMGEHTGGTIVRAAVLPATADRLIIGGLPRGRVPILLVIFALAGGLALLAASLLRRENQLARLRSDFVASVSHELRTPLAQVRLFVETLRLGRARDEAERSWALGQIERETLRLGGLVENILHFSRAERGVARLERERADVAEEVGDAVGSFALLLPKGRARIEVAASAGLLCELDRDAFRQVLLNLLDNAVKYGPAGQTIRVSAERVGDRVVVRIDDEGPGVPVRERERVWEPFQRGAGAVGQSVAGSGIGLAVVREIVRGHGGTCRMEAAPGGGGRVVVELPAPLSAAPPAHVAPERVLAERGVA